MNIDPLLLISFLGSVLMIGFAFSYLYYLYNRDNELKEKQKELNTESNKQLELARARAKDIMDQAVDKAKGLLSDTENIKKDISTNMQKSTHEVVASSEKKLEDLSSVFLKTYEGILQQLNTHMTATSDTMVKTMQSEADKTIQTFGLALKQETEALQKQTNERLNAEYQKIQQEVVEYKKVQIEGVRKQVEGIGVKLLEETLKESIPPELHDKLVMASLNQAKKEGLLK